MKLSAITTGLLNNSQQKTQSFKGLTGKASTEIHSDSFQYSEDTYINYYPFKDETEAEIDRFKASNSRSSHDCADSSKVNDAVSNYSSTSYVVKERLPITKKEYSAYQNNPSELSFDKRLLIKNIVEEIEREKK